MWPFGISVTCGTKRIREDGKVRVVARCLEVKG
jgi:hypothetical protein